MNLSVTEDLKETIKPGILHLLVVQHVTKKAVQYTKIKDKREHDVHTCGKM